MRALSKNEINGNASFNVCECMTLKKLQGVDTGGK